MTERRYFLASTLSDLTPEWMSQLFLMPKETRIFSCIAKPNKQSLQT